MSTITIQLPNSLLHSIQVLANAQGLSVEQFIVCAAAVRVAAIQSLGHMRREAAAGRREDFDRYMAAVPDVDPDEQDRLPD
jgi:hypothetical protein